MSTEETTVSVDCEYTGPIPAVYSMISLGAVAYNSAGKEIGRFKINLKELPGSTRDPETMIWWSEHSEAWELATQNSLNAGEAMQKFAAWLETLPGIPKLAGWPLPVDFMFIYWYYTRFIGKPPFGYDGIDIKSYAMAKLNVSGITKISRDKAREAIGIPIKEFSHEPVDDALQQAEIYFGLKRLR